MKHEGRTVEIQAIINIGATVIIGVMGWFARQLWDAVKELRTDIQDLKVSLPTEYVSKSDHTAALEKIEKGLDRIYAKLDGKADK